MEPKPLFIEPSYSWEDGLTAAVYEKYISIAVAEERAVDSYSENISCEMFLSLEQARQLRDWLNAAIAHVGAYVVLGEVL